MEVGIDLVKIENVSALKDLTKVFSQNELAYFKTHRSFDTIAGAFAAKEAFLKCIKVAFNVYPLTEIEVLHSESGAPYLAFNGQLAEYVKKERLSFSLSISHDGQYATAIVISSN